MYQYLLYMWIFLCGTSVAQVVELVDDFILQGHTDPWLIKFYAPSCGYCKKLEPTYQEVAVLLQQSGIKVGKIDATIYRESASAFKVRGFPTIILVDGKGGNYTYQGSRTAQDISEFAYRASQPAVRHIVSSGHLEDALSAANHEPVFVLVLESVSSVFPLQTSFFRLADTMKTSSHFLSASSSIFPSKEANAPCVIVIKDGRHVLFIEDHGDDETELDANLNNFFILERWSLFPRVESSSLHRMLDCPKLLAILATPSSMESTRNGKEILRSYKSNVEVAMKDNMEEFYSEVQLVWMPDTEVARNVLMSSDLEQPVFFVLRANTSEYFMPNQNVAELSAIHFADFLRNVLNGKVEPLGGHGWMQVIKRTFFNIFVAIASIFAESAVLGCLLIGVPLCFISFLCYILSTASDDEESFDDDDLSESESTECDPQVEDKIDATVHRRNISKKDV